MNTLKSLIIATALTMPILAYIAPPAKADLTICNKTPDKAFVAKAWYDGQQWVSSGWTHVFAGECEVVHQGDLHYHPIYVYVSDNNWNAWQLKNKKTDQFCLKQTAFDIVDADKPCIDNMIRKTFYRIVTEQTPDFTLNLK